MRVLTAIWVLSRCSCVTNEAVVFLKLWPCWRSIFLVRLSCRATRRASLAVLCSKVVLVGLVLPLHIVLAWRGRQYRFRRLVWRSGCREQLHGICEYIRQVKGARRHLVLAWTALRGLWRREEGIVALCRCQWLPLVDAPETRDRGASA